MDGVVVWTKTAPKGDGGAVYPVLPDGCMDLLWIGGRLGVAGPDTRAYRPPPPGEDGFTGDCTGVRFAPGIAPALLGVPAHELRDRRVDLADLWPGAEAREIAERLAAADDPAAVLEAVALRRLALSGPPDPLLRAVVAGLDAGRPVASVAESAGLGPRRLHRRSLDAFGYGPKTLARVLRLQRALALVRASVPYAEAAALAGCADQAHLARETRALAGLTLGAYATLANSETPQPSGSSTTA
ncbi:helix-turn-helix domain-containing protein [Streptomyces sp. NBC_01498]|uniref:helix-turn-helix domain-containing protein n=1 Tax=Streptomyces sp. NBC_01498 TaxID=2975870 RepID=UPI002E7B04A1|nr:helix-turn-helix domain-containing protein [Streptomyces sp. NBC_01498]WTL28682.1 helix-turn-helix domain-containing protein [Streptomyces sp. NBC_01498]